MRRKVQQQGSADGLCGIYALLNFCQRLEYFDDPDLEEGPFWFLLEAMAAEGLLSPFYLIYGLQSQQIRAIANKVFEDHDLPFRAVSLSKVLNHRQVRDFVDLAPDLFEAEYTAAVVAEVDKSHWVLIDDWKAGYLQVRDSNATSRVRVGRSANFKKDGVVILPVEQLESFTGHA